MTNGLVIRTLADGRFEWANSALEANTRARVGDAAALAAHATQPVCVLLDGRDVATLTATIPARSARQAAQAAPYAIEDEVAEEVESLHVNCGPALANDGRALAVVKSELLNKLTSSLTEHGIRLGKIAPEYLALPYRAGRWTLLRDADRVLVRFDAAQGCAMDFAIADTLLARRAALAAPNGVDLFGFTESPLALAGLPCEHHPLPHGPLALLAQQANETDTLDITPESLRRAEGAGTRANWLSWGLLALALIIHLGFSWRTQSASRTELTRLAETQAQIMQSAFPEITRVVNAEAQATQAVAALRDTAAGGLGLLEMLGNVAGAIAGQPEARLKLEGINYGDGVMNLRLSAPDIKTLESFAAQVSGLHVEVVSVETRARDISGALRVQGVSEATP